jgi:hypothetical protein
MQGQPDEVDLLVSTHSPGALWRLLALVAASIFLVALLALVAISIDGIYVDVIKPLLTSNGLTSVFWAGALIAGAIPTGFLSIYSCILILRCGKWIWKFISRQSQS